MSDNEARLLALKALSQGGGGGEKENVLELNSSRCVSCQPSETDYFSDATGTFYIELSADEVSKIRHERCSIRLVGNNPTNPDADTNPIVDITFKAKNKITDSDITYLKYESVKFKAVATFPVIFNNVYNEWTIHLKEDIAVGEGGKLEIGVYGKVELNMPNINGGFDDAVGKTIKTTIIQPEDPTEFPKFGIEWVDFPGDSSGNPVRLEPHITIQESGAYVNADFLNTMISDVNNGKSKTYAINSVYLNPSFDEFDFLFIPTGYNEHSKILKFETCFDKNSTMLISIDENGLISFELQTAVISDVWEGSVPDGYPTLNGLELNGHMYKVGGGGKLYKHNIYVKYDEGSRYEPVYIGWSEYLKFPEPITTLDSLIRNIPRIDGTAVNVQWAETTSYSKDTLTFSAVYLSYNESEHAYKSTAVLVSETNGVASFGVGNIALKTSNSTYWLIYDTVEELSDTIK